MGFTLVELVAVITMVGILASVGLVRLSHVKERARLAAMKTDLHNLMLEQEAHYIEFGVYASSVAADGSVTPTSLAFRSSEGSDEPVLTAIAGGGYTVTIANRIIVGTRSCSASIGGTAPWPRSAGSLLLPAEGEIVCD